MASETEAIRKINFIESELPKLIVQGDEFKGFEVVRCTAELSSHLDGFMSAIYMVSCNLYETVQFLNQQLWISAAIDDEGPRRDSVSTNTPHT